MDMPDWVTTFPGSVMVSDLENRILWMNDKAAAVYEADGGKKLVGTDLDGCHNDRSRGMLRHMITSGEPNMYTIEKKGIKKFIYQTAWKDPEGRTAGLVELSLEIPFDMPHYIRK